MDESVILKVIVDQEELRLLAPVMKLVKKAGEHTTASLSGILDPGKKGQEDIAMPGAEIEVYNKGIDELLFRGIIKGMELGMETADADPLKRLDLELVSGTYLLDRKRADRAFQSTTVDYQSVAGSILNGYKGAAIMMKQEIGGTPLGRPIIQYQETDWMFLKRLLSRAGQLLIPDDTSCKPQIYAGLMNAADVYEIPLEEEEQIQGSCYIGQGDGEERLEYIWMTERSDVKTRNVGEAVQYRGTIYHIKEAEILVKDAFIHHRYRFCLPSGFRVREMQNPYMTGLALPGTVSKVAGDQVQVRLDIDVLEERDYWYTYSTFYSTFYCMPEIGDRVHLYMPNSREEQAFVLNSIRDKVGSRAKSSGGFQAGASVDNNDQSEGQGSLKAEKKGTDIVSWLEAVSRTPYGTLMGIGLSTSEGEKNGQEQSGEEQGREEQETKKNGVPTQAVYSGDGVQSQVPDFDFQDLYDNEDVKVLSTRDDKMIILDDKNDRVSICYSNGTFIVLKGDGIQINAEGYLHLRASGNINLTADGSMVIMADEQIVLNCQKSQLLISSEGVGINGTDIKINE